MLNVHRELHEAGVQGEQLSPETIESSEALANIVATLIDSPKKSHAFVVCHQSSLVLTRSTCSIHLVDFKEGKLVCNRSPLEMCTVLGSEMLSSGHFCAECVKKSQ